MWMILFVMVGFMVHQHIKGDIPPKYIGKCTLDEQVNGFVWYGGVLFMLIVLFKRSF